MSSHEFDNELFRSVKGTQYGYQLYVHSLVASGQKPLSLAQSSGTQILADFSATTENSNPVVSVRLWPTDGSKQSFTPLEIRKDQVRVPALVMGNWRLRPLAGDVAFDLQEEGTYKLHVTLNQLMSGGTATSFNIGDWRIRPLGENLVIERMDQDGFYQTKMRIANQ